MGKTIFHALFLLSVVNLILSQTPYFPQGSPGKSHGLHGLRPDERIPGFDFSASANNPSVLPQFQVDYLNSLDAIVPDFQVNENGGPDGADQNYPSISMFPNGNFVITWEDGRTYDLDIYAQLYRADGSPLGTNFKINDDVEEGISHGFPVVSSDASGNFVIAWFDRRNGDIDIYAQRLTRNGDPLGSNFRVNDDQGSKSQGRPRISANSSGNFVISWIDYRNENPDVYAQRFSSNGNALGSNFKVNDVNGTVRSDPPSVSLNDDDNFIITWIDRRNDRDDVFAQLFSDDGSPLGLNFMVNDNQENVYHRFPSIYIYENVFVISWSDRRNADYDYDVYAQRFTIDGSPLGTNFRVNDDQGNEYQGISTISMNGGNFVIAWQDHRLGKWDIYAQRYAINGDPQGSNFKINTDTTDLDHLNPSISLDPAADFVITWAGERYNDYDIYAQRYTPNGIPAGTNFVVNDDRRFANQSSPSLCVDSNGSFVITWTDERNSDSDIYAKRYSGDGNALGSDFRVNDDTGKSGQANPSIAVDNLGNFVIAWEDLREKNQYWDVYAQRYDRNGSALGKNFKVSDDIGWAVQYNASIAADQNGNFVISWEDSRNKNYGFDIYAQRFSNDGTAMGTNFRVNDDQDYVDQSSPSVAFDGMGNFIIAWTDGARGNFDYDIYAQRYASDGNALGTNFNVIDDQTGEWQWYPSVYADNSGNFVIAWSDSRLGNWNIYAQRYASDGKKLGENFIVNDDSGKTYHGLVSISGNGGSDILMSWVDARYRDGGIYIQCFTVGGIPLGNNIKINMIKLKYMGKPKVKLCKNKIYTTWQGFRYLETDGDIWANILDWNTTLRIPPQYTLKQNYPNPFNSLTHIEFDVKEICKVTLRIYDIQGRLVSTLVDVNMAPGSYTVDFNAAGRASGIYFYHIKMGTFMATGKMILVR